MTDRRRWAATIAALALAIVAAGTAFGYAGEIANSVTVTRVTDPVVCCKPLTLAATVRDAQGKLIQGQPVRWSWVTKVAGDDVINEPDTLAETTTTNANGVARITVTLAAAPGTRVVQATADGVSGRVTINLTAAGLPRTSTLAAAPVQGDSTPGILLAVLALVVGSGLVLRRAVVRA